MKMKRREQSIKLKKNEASDFYMEQLLSQPLNPDYPPVLYTYDWQKVYKKIDAGEDVCEYIDYDSLAAMKSTVDQLAPEHRHNGDIAAYVNILEVWG